MKPQAILFGANSAIAQALLPHLMSEYRVLAVSRRPAPDLPEGVRHFPCDYSETGLADLVELVKQEEGPLTALICAVGVLHNSETTSDKTTLPEKKLAELNSAQLTEYFAVNSIAPALIMKYFIPLMPRSEPSKAIMLSAKIAGISDNRLGGWYGYRASKAALNMLVKTASVELARSHRKLSLIALHPGTTDTPLSKPFTGSLGPDKLFSPAQTAERLWHVIKALGPEDTGRFVHWDGSDLPW